MARNIEIKARVADLQPVRERAAAFCDSGPTITVQTDTFYTTPTGRLKLREFADGRGELIAYRRADTRGPKCSDYRVVPVVDPRSLDQALALVPGRRGVVRKRRELYLAGQTRIHLDQVDGLGAFVELEVVLEEGQSENRGEKIAQDLLGKLGVAAEQQVAEAYIDLLEAAGR